MSTSAGGSQRTMRRMGMQRTLRTIVALAVAATLALGVAQTEVRVISFSQGFAFTDLFGDDGTQKTQRLLDFEAREGIRVTMEWGDEDAARQKVLNDLIAGTGRYDILMLGTDGGIQTYGYAGFLHPLNDYLQSGDYDAYFDFEDMYASVLDANTLEGNVYGLSYYAFGPGMIYRTDIFERYGVTPPTTMAEFETVLATLKEGLARDGVTDVYPLTMRAAPGEEPTLDLAGFVYAYAGYPAWFEGGAVTPDEIRATNAQPIFTGDFREGFEAFVRLAREYGPPGIATHSWVDMMNLYGQGKAVILFPSAINGYAGAGFSELDEVRDNTGYAPSPLGPSGEMVQSFWSFSFGINAASRNKDAAMKVLALLTGTESLQNFADRIQWPAVPYASVMNSATLVERFGAEEVRLNEQAMLDSDTHYFPYIPELSDFMFQVGTAASQAVATGDVDRALNELQRWAVETMRAAGYYR
jgi:sorbitol/mannitol transport system substrate-binding protein